MVAAVGAVVLAELGLLGCFAPRRVWCGALLLAALSGGSFHGAGCALSGLGGLAPPGWLI